MVCIKQKRYVHNTMVPSLQVVDMDPEIEDFDDDFEIPEDLDRVRQNWRIWDGKKKLDSSNKR